MTRRGRRRRRRRSRCKRLKPCLTGHVITSDARYIALCRWMKANSFSVKHCHLRPAEFNDIGRGLMATRKFHPSDMIVSLPKKLLITADLLLSTQFGKVLRSMPEKITLCEALCVYLICERQLGCHSFWYPYIQFLPTAYALPAYWTHNELRHLPCELQDEANLQKAQVQASWQAVREFVHQLCSSLTIPGADAAFTYDMYLWAWATVNSRSVFLPTSAATSQHFAASSAQCNLALAPFLDLLNHSASCEVTAALVEKSECYEVRTLTGCDQYQQMFICYGPHNNNSLLLEYGFVLKSNPYNVVNFTIGNFSLQNIKRKHSIMQASDINKCLSCSMDGVSWNLSAAVTLLALESDQLQYWRDYIYGTRKLTESSKICTLLQYMLNRKLKKCIEHCQSVKQDEVTAHTELAKAVCEDERQILQQCINATTTFT